MDFRLATIRLIVLVFLGAATAFFASLFGFGLTTNSFSVVERGGFIYYMFSLIFAQSNSPATSASAVLVALAAHYRPDNSDVNGFSGLFHSFLNDTVFIRLVLVIGISGLAFLEVSQFIALSNVSLEGISANLSDALPEVPEGSEQSKLTNVDRVRMIMQSFFVTWRSAFMLYVAAILGIKKG